MNQVPKKAAGNSTLVNSAQTPVLEASTRVGGGNQTRERLCDKELRANELHAGQGSVRVSGERAGDIGCQKYSRSDIEVAPSISFIAEAWPHLPPHVRETICTVIDAALLRPQVEGGIQ